MIDLAAIAHNTRLLAQTAGVAVLAVVKANGFGHGAVPVARTALAHGADWLGVTSCTEALQLREAGITAPILSWLHPPGQDFTDAVAAGIDLSVSSEAELAAIAATARRLGSTALVHLKIDTGLSRNGAGRSDWLSLVRAAGRAERSMLVHVRGMWSHLASAEVSDSPETERQLERFCHALEIARGNGLDPQLLHLANSAAALQSPQTRLDLVRVGAALYGIEPIEGRRFGLRPAMTLTTRAVSTKRVGPGTGVSYRHRYRTSSETSLALVPLGYADGVPTRAGAAAQVLIGGQRRPIAGRIAMDQFVVDLGDADWSGTDEVIVFGPGERGEPTAVEWAGWADTVVQELYTGIGPRVARSYLPAGPRR